MARFLTSYDEYEERMAQRGRGEVTGPDGRNCNLYYDKRTKLWMKKSEIYVPNLSKRDLNKALVADVDLERLTREMRALDYYRQLHCHTPEYQYLCRVDEKDYCHFVLLTEHVAGKTMNEVLRDNQGEPAYCASVCSQYVLSHFAGTLLVANIDDNAGNIIFRDEPFDFGKGEEPDFFTHIDTDFTMGPQRAHNVDCGKNTIEGSAWQDDEATDGNVIYMLEKHLHMVTQDSYWDTESEESKKFGLARNMFAHYEFAMNSGQVSRQGLVDSLNKKTDLLEQHKASFDPLDYQIMQRRAGTARTYLQTAPLPKLSD